MKYVIYKRVSTKKQGKSGLGLNSQQTIISHFVNQSSIVAEFTEVASAKYMDCNNRPELCKAIELCKANGYTLVVAKIDRLSRTTEDALYIYNALDGKLESCDIPNLDKFTLTLFMAIADRERELISIRTKAALAEKKKQGVKLGKPSNFTATGRKAGCIANSEIARNNKVNLQATDIATDKKNSGWTLTKIATHLNGLGYKTVRGKEYKATTIKRLLERNK